MNRTRVALILFALAGTAAAWWIAAGPERHPPPHGAPSPPAPDSGPEPPAPPPPALDAVAWRSADEGILFVRRRPWGLPASGAEVTLLAGEGPGAETLGVLRTDGTGVLRTPLPARGAVRYRIADGERPLEGAFPPAPAPAAAGPASLFADRTVLRPGDRLRVAVPYGVADPGGEGDARLTLEGLPPIPLRPSPPPEGSGRGRAWWTVLEATVPDDACPGTARVKVGSGGLRLPVRPRFGEGAFVADTAEEEEDAGSPEGPPSDGEDGTTLSLEPTVEGWRVGLREREEGSAVLLFAWTPSRFLTHAAVVPREAEVVVPLPERGEETLDLRVTAVAATPEGFLRRTVRIAADEEGGPRIRIRGLGTGGSPVPVIEAHIVATGNGPPPHLPMALALEDPRGFHPEARLAVADLAGSLRLETGGLPHGVPYRVRAAAATGRGGHLRTAEAEIAGPWNPPEPRPAFLREGDRPETPCPGVEVRPAEPVPVRAVLRPGEPVLLLDRGKPLPAGVEVGWRVVAPDGTAGPFRIRAGRGIVLEARIEPSADGDPGAGRSGTLRSDALGARELSLESGVEGLRAVVLRAELPAGGERPALDEGFAVGTTLPPAAAAGETIQVRVTVAAEAAREGPVEVVLPLPAGLVPAEDGWSVAAAAPPGTRVSLDRERVAWHLPSLAPGETVLPVRLRAAFPGRYRAPAGTAATADPAGPRGRSASGAIRIE